MRQCSRCKKSKEETEFGKQSGHKDGLSYWCKDCKHEYARKYYRKEEWNFKKYFKLEERHRVVNGVREKRCSRCKKWQAESEFYKRSRHKDGLAVWCKTCADKATNKCRRMRTSGRATDMK